MHQKFLSKSNVKSNDKTQQKNRAYPSDPVLLFLHRPFMQEHFQNPILIKYTLRYYLNVLSI